MKIAVLIVRILLGLMLVVFGLNGFLNFIPMTEAPPEAAGAFAGALAKSGYMMPMVKGLEVLIGILLLTDLFVPLALILLAPLSVNMFAFHLFLAPSSIGGAAAVTVLNIFLMFAYIDSYRPLLRAKPGTKG